MFHDLFSLVGLQVSDEVPRQRKLRQRFDLRKRLLEPILADITDTAVHSLANVLWPDCFCYGDQFDGRRIAPALLSRLSNSVQYPQAVFPDIAHRALRVRGGFVGRLSPATKVSSS